MGTFVPLQTKENKRLLLSHAMYLTGLPTMSNSLYMNHGRILILHDLMSTTFQCLYDIIISLQWIFII